MVSVPGGGGAARMVESSSARVVVVAWAWREEISYRSDDDVSSIIVGSFP